QYLSSNPTVLQQFLSGNPAALQQYLTSDPTLLQQFLSSNPALLQQFLLSNPTLLQQFLGTNPAALQQFLTAAILSLLQFNATLPGAGNEAIGGFMSTFDIGNGLFIEKLLPIELQFAEQLQSANQPLSTYGLNVTMESGNNTLVGGLLGNFIA